MTGMIYRRYPFGSPLRTPDAPEDVAFLSGAPGGTAADLLEDVHLDCIRLGGFGMRPSHRALIGWIRLPKFDRAFISNNKPCGHDICFLPLHASQSRQLQFTRGDLLSSMKRPPSRSQTCGLRSICHNHEEHRKGCLSKAARKSIWIPFLGGMGGSHGKIILGHGCRENVNIRMC